LDILQRIFLLQTCRPAGAGGWFGQSGYRHGAPLGLGVPCWQSVYRPGAPPGLGVGLDNPATDMSPRWGWGFHVCVFCHIVIYLQINMPYCHAKCLSDSWCHYQPNNYYQLIHCTLKIHTNPITASMAFNLIIGG
jgi:hypothetical protein